MKNASKFALTMLGTLAAGPALAQGGPDLGLGYATEIGLGSKDIRTTIAGMIKTFMGLLGIVAVVLILYGGFKYMTSQGEPGKVDEAKKVIIAGVIGLAIILSAYAIASFVLGAIQTGTA